LLSVNAAITVLPSSNSKVPSIAPVRLAFILAVLAAVEYVTGIAANPYFLP
jgi:hypothetical protein